ncbi:MAG: DUF1007 family protein [Syntrophaceae bacterium]|nr:DUF1007 family protein [Syntrophaceae bacterium]
MVCKKFLIIGMLAFSLLWPAVTSWSHPHVFLSNTVQVVFDEKGVEGFTIRWIFDEIFSSMIILDFDKNGNNRFEPSEIENVKQGAFTNLRNFDYFTHITINGTEFKVRYVTDFTAEILNDALVYQFFVPCHVQATETFKELRISVYDHTFYCDVALEENSVTYQRQDSYEIVQQIGTNNDKAYYYGQIYPEEITLKFRRRK